MSKPLLYDVFCGSGGAARGYMNAGFRVIGVDDKPQPHFCGDSFMQMDAFEFFTRYLKGEYEVADAIHASPPCQYITHAAAQWRKAGRRYPEFVVPTRKLLLAAGRPYILEQPMGKVLMNPILLNGAFFGLRVKRDRYFETNWPLEMPLLNGEERPAHFGRPFDANKGELFYPVGHFSGVAAARQAMGIDWMTGAELTQAIPPAYTEFIGKALMDYLNG